MTGGRKGSGVTVLNIAPLYQAIVNALRPWPYGPVVQGRHTQRYLEGMRGEIFAVVDTWQ